MRLIITTVYENITDEFLNNYIHQSAQLNSVAKLEELKEKKTVQFRTDDPDSNAFGITTIELKKGKDE